MASCRKIDPPGSLSEGRVQTNTRASRRAGQGQAAPEATVQRSATAPSGRGTVRSRDGSTPVLRGSPPSPMERHERVRSPRCDGVAWDHGW
jgi:hypothetical protein